MSRLPSIVSCLFVLSALASGETSAGVWVAKGETVFLGAAADILPPSPPETAPCKVKGYGWVYSSAPDTTQALPLMPVDGVQSGTLAISGGFLSIRQEIQAMSHENSFPYNYGTNNEQRYQHDCDGQQFPMLGVYYTMTADDPPSSEPSYNWSPLSPGSRVGYGPGPYTYYFFYSLGKDVQFSKIRLSNYDLEKNTYVVDLEGPANEAGPIEVTFGGENSFTYIDNSRNYAAGSGQLLKIDRTKIPPGTYTSIVLKWKLPSTKPTSKMVSLNNKFVVFGLYRHSVYNTPSEQTCPADLLVEFRTM